jgi:hypothetical protein
MAHRSGLAETLVEQARDLAGGWYRIRWGRRKSFTTTALVRAFLGDLKDAARDGTPFDWRPGCPLAQAIARDGKPAIATTARRMRAVVGQRHRVAVDLGLLPGSLVGRLEWKTSDVAETVGPLLLGRHSRPSQLFTVIIQGDPVAELE